MTTTPSGPDTWDADLAAVARLRNGTALDADRALDRSRALLERAIEREAGHRSAPARRWPRPMPARRLVQVAVAATIVLAAVLGPALLMPGRSDTADAAELLRSAARVSAATTWPTPRSDQFIYSDQILVAGTQRQHTQEWTSVDGTRAGMTLNNGFLGNGTAAPSAQDGADGSLQNATYAVLAALPTDPTALLDRLAADPAVLLDMSTTGSTQEEAIWALMRALVREAPPQQRAALFNVAALIPGIDSTADVTDAAGRAGTAVGLLVPGLGHVELIFDPTSHVFLGERILTIDGGSVMINHAILTTAVVDEAGQVPAG